MINKLIQDVLPLITILFAIWAGIYSYNEFIAENKQQALMHEMTAHIDGGLDELRMEIRNLPNAAAVENAQLRAMIYSKDLIDEKTRNDDEKFKALEKRIDQMAKLVERESKNRNAL